MIDKKLLTKLYLKELQSARQIATVLKCSETKINYWLKAYGIPKRTISAALYTKLNPNGDPFTLHKISSQQDAFLYGLGLGLYWGEGNKSNTHSIRLGNTDPGLILAFISFLQQHYGVKKERLRFGLQIFSDMDPGDALTFWQSIVKVPLSQFQKVIVTPARSLGTYRNKTKHGVLTVYFNNKKLRDLVCGEIERLGQMY